MRDLLFIIFLLYCTTKMSAQCDDYKCYADTAVSTIEIQAVINACIAMRDAVAQDDTAAIRLSSESLRAAKVSTFSSLKCQDDLLYSLNGHLLFDEVFADSLAEGRDVYSKADDINRTIPLRGQTPDGSILTKTCFVKAGQSTRYTFKSKGHQELAVVAEAGGLVTMKIHVTNNAGLDFRKDDTTFVHQGRPHRKTAFELPNDRVNFVELEIKNCGKKDCSFVVISN